MLSCEEAFEIYWKKYWEGLEKLMPQKEMNDLLTMGMKKALKAAYKSGFYTSRDLSIENDRRKNDS